MGGGTAGGLPGTGPGVLDRRGGSGDAAVLGNLGGWPRRGVRDRRDRAERRNGGPGRGQPHHPAREAGNRPLRAAAGGRDRPGFRRCSGIDRAGRQCRRGRVLGSPGIVAETARALPFSTGDEADDTAGFHRLLADRRGRDRGRFRRHDRPFQCPAAPLERGAAGIRRYAPLRHDAAGHFPATAAGPAPAGALPGLGLAGKRDRGPGIGSRGPRGARRWRRR